MKTARILVSLLLLGTIAFSQKTPYIIYNTTGEVVSYEEMLSTLQTKDIILFGERHNNPISHWLQYEVTSDLHKTRKLILGAEMFEADNQTILNDYVNDSITYTELDSLARLWSNYETDYAPLVDFAKENQLQFVATNIPRRYASLVYQKGFDALDSLAVEEKEWIAPLPIPFDSELATYKSILEDMGEHGSPELVQAQAVKDATMAYFIVRNYKTGYQFIHYNGTYHSDFYEGILWYLLKQRDDLAIGTISTVSQEDVHELLESNIGKADFIICVDENMTKTY
jgi:uncharacterized iron-regulated protein